MTRWRGLKDLIVDAVHHGVTGVETVHRRTARTTIEVVARVPGLGGPARAVSALQDAAIAATYEAIRRANGALGTVVGLVLDATEHPRIDTADSLPEPSHSRSIGGQKP
jgi:hypothetical protein